jgi:elongation of very long chain fatty acids protein 6
LLYAWFSCTDFAASGRWCVVMNFTVHAFMYSYYGFRALHFNIPKWVNIAITSMQIIQMVFGVYINVSAYFLKRSGGNCDISDENLNFAFLMYFSYLILFSNFFYQTYLSPTNKRSRKGGEKTSTTHTDEYIKNKIKQANKFQADSKVNYWNLKKYVKSIYKKSN